MSGLWDPSTYTPGYLNDYQAQSWRDSYNGGRAAGDFTGTVNNRLDRERDAFQGATWSGSSTQLSALEYARAGGSGPGHSAVSTGSGGAGPGSSATRTGSGGAGAGSGSVGTGTGGRGSGSRLVLSAPGGSGLSWGVPLKPELETAITQFQVGGAPMRPHEGTSNMAEVEDRWGDAEFLSPAWFTSWAIAGFDVLNNAANTINPVFGTGVSAGEIRRQERDAAYDMVYGPGRVGADGTTWRNGGGF